ncbi:helix-turn-helix domain-containing protein [Pontibaca salina]|uniref:Helix-turn-helix transcriptional regulator n=1 Tax=Pontibaca salina TaxID=2795731 RepID=A0A934HN98_9RHOB|nr:XRE family transcriptional regulator [Pontibaca salina]MBI6630106.1 helix-turn-helix transcriptional regulator [Pontibaca salina]
MHRPFSSQPCSLGADLRALRKTRGLTLAQLAQRLGRSLGWLSQVERDLSGPSLEDLREIAAALDVPPSMLATQSRAPEREAGFIVRQNGRRPIGKRIPGLGEELLSPDLTDSIEVVHSTFAPNSRLPQPISRPTQEVGYLVSGCLDLTIAERCFTIHPGDSFRIRGETFQWSNPYDQPAVVIWIIAPPIY